MTPKLLLLEDDLSLGETLAKRLNKNGFEATWFQTLDGARKSFSKKHYDLFIFDIGLPDGSGFDLASELKSDQPIIFLTALNDAENRLKGYELGAYDYIPKPFHLKELFIRIKKALPPQFHQKKYRYGNILVNFDTMAIERDETLFNLSHKDFQVLSYLINESPKVLSRDEILDHVWGKDNYPSNRTIDNIILRLRQSLGERASQLIRSIRGVGYQWTEGPNHE